MCKWLAQNSGTPAKLPTTKNGLASAIRGMCHVKEPVDVTSLRATLVHLGYVASCGTCNGVVFLTVSKPTQEVPPSVLKWLSNKQLHCCVKSWAQLDSQLISLSNYCNVNPYDVIDQLYVSGWVSEGSAVNAKTAAPSGSSEIVYSRKSSTISDLSLKYHIPEQSVPISSASQESTSENTPTPTSELLEQNSEDDSHSQEELEEFVNSSCTASLHVMPLLPVVLGPPLHTSVGNSTTLFVENGLAIPCPPIKVIEAKDQQASQFEDFGLKEQLLRGM